MKILFLGGTGNISTECAERLHGQGHEIWVLSRGHQAVPPAYRPFVADRKDPQSMRAALGDNRPDVVLNFVGYEVADVQADFELFQGQVRQYLFISSATVYAKPPGQLPITETAPRGNRWWDYAQKKLDCEQWLEQRHQEHGFPVTLVRPSHTYSKRWIPSPIASANYNFAARLEEGKPVFVPDNGENPWTLTAASDFAVGLAGLVGHPEAIGQSFHITGDEVLTWNQIVAEISAALGVSAPQVLKIPTDFICQVVPSLTGNLKGDKSHPGVFDNSKIKKFVPEFATCKPFRVGVRESVAWLRAHPEQQNRSPQVEATMETITGAWMRENPSRTLRH